MCNHKSQPRPLEIELLFAACDYLDTARDHKSSWGSTRIGISPAPELVGRQIEDGTVTSIEKVE
ncbi:hypothetical protein MnBA_39820 [Marinobacterium sp. BA1]